MARGINKVILIGNTGTAPEIRYTPTGAAVTTLSLATTDTWKDKNTNEKQERTEWHRVVCFNRLAEIAGEYVRKGARIYIEGNIRTRKWQDQQGQDRYTTEIIANDLQLLDSKSSQSQETFAPEHNHEAFTNTFNTTSKSTSTSESNTVLETETFSDDIPF